MKVLRYWSETESKMIDVATKDAGVVTLTTLDPYFDGEYVRKEAYDARTQNQEFLQEEVARGRRRNRFLFWGASLAIGLTSVISYNLGLQDGRDEAPDLRYVETQVPQVHTVIDYEPFEVPIVFCPREDSCMYEWYDDDHDGWGEARLVEVMD